MRIRPRLRTLRAATFNCHQGRDPVEVRRAVEAFCKDHMLHIVALQEANQFIDELRKIPRWKVVGWDECGTAIMARKYLQVDHVEVVPVGTDTWPFKRDHNHPVRKMIVCVVEGWLRFNSVHYVPSPDTNPKRQEQYKLGCEMNADWLNKHPFLPLCQAGDWNKVASDRGPATPAWVAEQASRPGVPAVLWGTHSVTFPMTRKVRLSNLRVVNEGGSDHPLILFTLHKKVAT